MAWLPFYAYGSDFDLLLQWLNADSETVFVVAREPEIWIRLASLDCFQSRRYSIWHLKSGPNLFHGADEWHEAAAAGDPDNPYWGSDPRVFTLNINLNSKESEDGIGISSFGWVRDRYVAIGKGAPHETKVWWNRLQRWFRKTAVMKIPRKNALNYKPEIWAFPAAFDRIQGGAKRDLNP